MRSFLNQIDTWLMLELALLDNDPQARRSVWRRAYRRFIRKGGWLFFVIFPVVVVPLVQGALFAFAMTLDAVPRAKTVLVVIGCAVVAPLLSIGVGFVAVITLVRFMRPCVRAELRERGIALYVKCGYDLRGNESGVCPECGTPCRENAE